MAKSGAGGKDRKTFLLAVVFLNFKVRVEAEDNLLIGFWGVNDPFTVLMGGVVLWVAR